MYLYINSQFAQSSIFIYFNKSTTGTGYIDFCRRRLRVSPPEQELDLDVKGGGLLLTLYNIIIHIPSRSELL